jgi:hypothetical protein
MSVNLRATKFSSNRSPFAAERRLGNVRRPSRSALVSRGQPVPWSDQLSKRAETIHNAVLDLGRVSSSSKVDEWNTEDDVVLSFHGVLSASSAPQLEAVLDEVLLLQPLRLVVDLSEVSQVSADTLNTLLWCAIRNDNVVLRSPDARTRAEVTRRGHARWIEPDPVAH